MRFSVAPAKVSRPRGPLPYLLALLVLGLPPPLLAADGRASPAVATHYGFRVVASHPHDPAAFTQGLLFSGGRLFESTGGYGESSVRIVQIESGRVLRHRRLPANRFGEGLALVEDRLLQLTWRAGIGHVWDATTLAPLAEFHYSGEGWGLAFHAGHLVLSDGSADLRFLDPNSFAVRRTIRVRDENGPVPKLNELEMVEGNLYANVWQTDRIAIIDPDTGQVRSWLDLAGILPLVFQRPDTGELNGIAYDAAKRRLFVTGKRWPRLFEIELVPKPG